MRERERVRGTEREQTLFNHGNLFNINCFSEERKIEGGREWGTVREGRGTGRERWGEKVRRGFLVLSYGNFGGQAVIFDPCWPP